MSETRKPTEAEIAEHREFLAKITASHRKELVAMLDPRQLVAAQSVLDDLVNAAQEEIRFLHRVPAGDVLTEEERDCPVNSAVVSPVEPRSEGSPRELARDSES